jgi:acyl-CoA synthetase (AMP-forming)/AMP-acid ligase II
MDLTDVTGLTDVADVADVAEPSNVTGPSDLTEPTGPSDRSVEANFGGFRNVGEVLADRAERHPDRAAFVLDPGFDKAPQKVSYRELNRRAQWRADELRSRLAPGSRVVLALPTGPEFVEAYLGCLIAGLVAVPVPAAGSSPSSSPAARRLEAVIRGCGAGLVLPGADQEAGAGWVAWPGEFAAGAEPRETFDRNTVDRDTLAVLQYTSGSTGEPKGAMVTQGNILANVEAMAAQLRIGPEAGFGAWLPLYHDMGLFGLLTAPLLLGVTAVFMPPTAFLRRPLEWLRMLDRNRITFTAAPSFALELCLRAVTDEQLATLDLSALRHLINGSEPVDAKVLTAFTERFAAAGLRREAMTPAYGLAEATLFVSGQATTPARVITADASAIERGELTELAAMPGSAETSRSNPVLAGCGHWQGFDLRIVDPVSREVRPQGSIGEIWLRGPSVAAGYWDRPQITAAAFGASTASGETGWFRTGDLGALLDDELFVTGRLKEMLIVSGRNLFPQDLRSGSRLGTSSWSGVEPWSARPAARSVAAPCAVCF